MKLSLLLALVVATETECTLDGDECADSEVCCSYGTADGTPAALYCMTEDDATATVDGEDLDTGDDQSNDACVEAEESGDDDENSAATLAAGFAVAAAAATLF